MCFRWPPFSPFSFVEKIHLKNLRSVMSSRGIINFIINDCRNFSPSGHVRWVLNSQAGLSMIWSFKFPNTNRSVVRKYTTYDCKGIVIFMARSLTLTQHLYDVVLRYIFFLGTQLQFDPLICHFTPGIVISQVSIYCIRARALLA